MIDATTSYKALSFMDSKDQDGTTFRTWKGICCYKTMPFALKNAGAIYQSVMQTIFEDMLHEMVKCCVDDLVVKSKKRLYHFQDLCQIFERLQKC